MEQKLTAKQVREAIDRLYGQVLDHLPNDAAVAVIGIRTRGETLAGRIVSRLEADRPDRTVRYGVLDITFYRDDLSRRRGAPLVRATEIDFDLDDTWVLLVDDVLQTGRSVRAALDALADFGRPRIVRLVALVDRGGRELPIAADFVGERVDAAPGSRVQVRLEETDGTEGVFILPQD
ncbi:MAG: bifunctional pyr operon transcriptional regulator/uracil phosphoribosyltransferase PyrR [Planctomycetota bacterium]